MNEIRGNAKNLRTLLANTKFSIDYYQREYRWQTKQVGELIEDLSSTFLAHFTPGDAQRDVKHYGHYFLGSVIVSEKDERKFIIDGQQRLTTLTLLLNSSLPTPTTVSAEGAAREPDLFLRRRGHVLQP